MQESVTLVHFPLLYLFLHAENSVTFEFLTGKLNKTEVVIMNIEEEMTETLFSMFNHETYLHLHGIKKTGREQWICIS